MDVGLALLPQHRRQISDLIEAIGVAEGHPAIGEHKYLALHRPQLGVAGVAGWEDGELVAFAPLAMDGVGRHVVELVVLPSHRRPATYAQMLEAAADLARAKGGKALRVWIFHPGVVPTAIALGFAEERQLLRLQRGLPVAEEPDFSEAIKVEPFQVGKDEDEWIRLNGSAFARHPENGAWGRGELAERMAQDWFSPENLIMAWNGNHLAGFIWLKLLDTQGEIYVVAVDPSAQGIGLGRALILEGLQRLEKVGCTEVCLYVDADNHRALRLYRSLGFFLDNVDRTLLKTL